MRDAWMTGHTVPCCWCGQTLLTPLGTLPQSIAAISEASCPDPDCPSNARTAPTGGIEIVRVAVFVIAVLAIGSALAAALGSSW